MRRHSFILCCLLFVPSLLMAQTEIKIADQETYQTGRVRLGANFNYKPVKGLSLTLVPEVYIDAFNFENGTNNNNTPFDKAKVRFEIGYKTCSYFKIGADYQFLAEYKDGKKSSSYNNFWDLRHRVDVDVMGILPIERWTLSLRERFRTTFRPDSTYYNPAEKPFAEMELKTRLKVSYKCFSKPLKPFLYIEMTNPLNVNQYIKDNLSTSDYWLTKMHYRIGLDWRLDGYSTLTFFYSFEHGKTYDVDIKTKKDRVVLTPEMQFTHTIGIYYTLDF